MHICITIYITCTHIHVYIHTYIYIHTIYNTHIYIYPYTYISMHIHIHIHINTDIHIHTYITTLYFFKRLSWGFGARTLSGCCGPLEGSGCCAAGAAQSPIWLDREGLMCLQECRCWDFSVSMWVSKLPSSRLSKLSWLSLGVEFLE